MRGVFYLCGSGDGVVAPIILNDEAPPLCVDFNLKADLAMFFLFVWVIAIFG